MLGKAQKTINFDKIVLSKLEGKAKLEGTTVSTMVNAICRMHVLSDEKYHEEMSRQYYMKMQEHQFLKEQARARRETNEG